MSLSKTTANLGVSLLSESGPCTENAFLSPASIAIALGMTYAGAKGTTAEEMHKVMFGKDLSKSDVHPAFAALHSALNPGADAGYKLHTANKVYAKIGYDVKKDFVELLAKHYDNEMQLVDFTKNKETAAEINSWVEGQTNNKIKDLINADFLDHLTRLILVNAIYFKGDWAHKFMEELTTEQTFYVAPEVEKKVPFMRQTAQFQYHESDDCKVLGMPYVKGELTFYAILPNERFGLAALEKSLTGEKLLSLIKSARETEVNVEMPKFKLEQSLQLNDALKVLGMGEMFDETKADFQGMANFDINDPMQRLYVSKVLHKAFIEVNEIGSEAAAASAVIMSNRCAMVSMGPPKKFICDQPFLFAIAHGGGGLLFVGRFVKV